MLLESLLYWAGKNINVSGGRYVIVEQNEPHYVTFTIVDSVDVFTRRAYRDVVVDSLNYCIANKGLKVYAWFIMSNHIHAILSAEDGYSLSAIIRDFKKHTAKQVLHFIEKEPESRWEWKLHRFEWAGKTVARITKYRFWQKENHAIHMNPLFPGMFSQKLNYIHDNPVRAGIVDMPAEYLYSSARDYEGSKGLVNVTLAFKNYISITNAIATPSSSQLIPCYRQGRVGP